MPKPPVRNPGDVIRASEWNQGWDWVQEGHGAGSNVDMLDGRHAAFGAWPALVPQDKLLLTIPNGFDDWLSIGRAAGRAWSLLAIGHTWTSRHDFWFGVVSRRYGGTESQHTAELSYSTKNRTLYGLRIVMDASDVHAPAYVQVRVRNDTGAAQELSIYRLQIGGGEEVAVPWELGDYGTGMPAGYVPGYVQVPGNGGWRLAKAFNTGATIGWLTPAQKQSIFTQTPNTPCLLDGSTANCITVEHGQTLYYVYDAGSPIALDAVRTYVPTLHCLGTGTRYTRLYVYYSHDGNNWTSLGYAQGLTGYLTKTFAAVSARYWKLGHYYYCAAGAGNAAQFAEDDFQAAMTLALANVPPGFKATLYDSSGNELEAHRFENWAGTGVESLMFVTQASNVAEIRITRPDGTTPWLSYPLWAIDGGALQNGDVLTLYAGG